MIVQQNFEDQGREHHLSVDYILFEIEGKQAYDNEDYESIVELHLHGHDTNRQLESGQYPYGQGKEI